jgi:hypothetical protein
MRDEVVQLRLTSCQVSSRLIEERREADIFDRTIA